MLDGNPPISKREHRWFFAALLSGLLIRVGVIVLDLAFPAPKSSISFGIYSIFDHWELMSPLYCIAAFMLCVPLTWKLHPGTLVFSLLPLGLLTFFFDYWFVDSQLLLSKIETIAPNYEIKTFDYLLVNGSVFDVITFLLVNVLIIWQANLIYRLFRFSK